MRKEGLPLRGSEKVVEEGAAMMDLRQKILCRVVDDGESTGRIGSCKTEMRSKVELWRWVGVGEH